MAKRRRETDSDGIATEMAEFNTVFIDTSLDTHLAMLVSCSDTVSDFKKKMAREHKQCFPDIGEIQIHSVKVKRRSNYYHLPDIMLVWSVFHGVKGNWFLSADASGTRICHLIKDSPECGTSNGVNMGVTNVDDNCRGLSSDGNRMQILPLPLPNGATEKNVVSEIIAGSMVEKSVEQTTDFHGNIYSEENCMGTESHAKKKYKVRHAQDASHNPSLKDGSAVFHAFSKETSIPKIAGCGNSMVDAAKECPGGIEQHGKPAMSDTTAEVSGVGNDQFDVEERLVFEGTSPPITAAKSNLGSIMNSQNLLGDNKRKEDNVLDVEMDYELGQDVPTEHSGGVSVKVPDLSAKLVDASGGVGDINTNGNKRKKEKVLKTAVEIQDRIDMKLTGRAESMKPFTETHKSEQKEEEKGLSLQHDHEIIMPSSSKASDHVDPDLALKEASFSQDADAVMEPEISSGIKKTKKKKKREKKSVDINAEKSGIEQIDNGINGSSGLPFPSTDHITEETGEEESIMPHKGKDVQMKLLDSSTLDIGEKVRGVKRNEANFVILTQTEQTLEEVGTGNKKTDQKVENSTGNCTVFHASRKDTSKPEIVSCGNSMADPMKESTGGVHEQHRKPIMSDTASEISGLRNDQFLVEDRLVFEGTSPPTTTEKSNLGGILNSQNLLGSDERKEKEDDALESKMHYELGQDVPIEHSGGARLIDGSSGLGDHNTDGNKRKKKKVQKTAIKIQDTTDMKQIGKGELMKAYTESHKSEKREEEKGLSLEHSHEVIMPSNSKASDHVDPDLPLKEAIVSQEADIVMESEISGGIKKKKKKKKIIKKPVDTNLEKSGTKQTDNGISSSDLLFPSNGHISEEAGEEESIKHREGKDVQMKLLDSSTLDTNKKVQGVKGTEADFVRLTQTEQTLEDVGTGNKKTDKKTQSSAGNCHADFPAVETEYQIVECNQVDKDKENTENKDRKSIKKRKKHKVTASGVQEDLPVKDQKVGIEALATTETPTSFANSEQESGHADLSQVLSHKCEEKLDEMHGIAINTDDLAENSEKECEGVDFKQYFVSGQHQHELHSGERVEKATKSNQEMRTSRKVNDLTSVSISTEVQNSIKSSENKKTENKSRRKGSGRSKGDSMQNSGIPNSFRRSSGASEKGVKGPRPGETCETTRQEPNEILPASSCLNKRDRSLDKSSSERSETFPRKKGNKSLQSALNVTNMMPMKTPQKKSLFTKSGTIFQDNSGESSGDENGTVHSNDNTFSPSESSSMSGHSVGESDLSQDSTRNGSNDEKGRSAGGRNMSKLDLSASKDMTMDMILRSSKRFKKAKFLASQNEDEQNESLPIEFVPDSQPM